MKVLCDSRAKSWLCTNAVQDPQALLESGKLMETVPANAARCWGLGLQARQKIGDCICKCSKTLGDWAGRCGRTMKTASASLDQAQRMLPLSATDLAQSCLRLSYPKHTAH